MAPLIALCDSRLYDQQDPVTLQDTEMVILCDSQPNSHPGDTDSVTSRRWLHIVSLASWNDLVTHMKITQT
ncbi:hypothetical protein GQ600_4786 [Phytophthora cactorum]|nr:hypothetical protein GQ600_4786 [Phytophthora cactorum]